MFKKGKINQAIVLKVSEENLKMMAEMYRKTHISRAELLRAGAVLLYEQGFKDGKPDLDLLLEYVAKGNGEVI
jgi:hypothetical protein